MYDDSFFQDKQIQCNTADKNKESYGAIHFLQGEISNRYFNAELVTVLTLKTGGALTPGGEVIWLILDTYLSITTG